MRIIFLSEMGFRGKVPRDHENMRVEFAQMVALDAYHHPMSEITAVQEEYDICILLVGKTSQFRDSIYNVDVVKEARRFSKKVLWMQEGPNWIFQDMPLHHQFWHYNILSSVDGLLVENISDIKYFEGLLSEEHWIESIPSLMITDNIEEYQSTAKEDKIILGGNFCRWYGGFDSYIVSSISSLPKYAPSMGRKIKGEDAIPDITYFNYMNWREWIQTLSSFKYGIHLMPTYGAGTFQMNCSYLGIPCISYKFLDTQHNLHPLLSVDEGDLVTAKRLLYKLLNDSDFYEHNSKLTKELYFKYHSEETFKTKMNKILNNLLNGN